MTWTIIIFCSTTGPNGYFPLVVCILALCFAWANADLKELIRMELVLWCNLVFQEVPKYLSIIAVTVNEIEAAYDPHRKLSNLFLKLVLDE